MPSPVHPEPEARAFAEATANAPSVFDLGPEQGGEAVDQVRTIMIRAAAAT